MTLQNDDFFDLWSADEAKLSSPICSICEALIMQRAVGHCYGEELGPLCWPMPASGIAIFSASY